MTATTTTRLGLYKTSSDGGDLVNVVTDLLNNLDAIDLNIGYRDCTSTTRPSTVWKGLPIRESDTSRLYISNGTAPASASWKQIPAEGASFLAAFTFASTLSVAGAVTLNSTLAVTGATTLTPTSTSTIPLTVNSPSGTSVDALRVSINSVSKLKVDSSGNTTAGGNLTVNTDGTSATLGKTGVYQGTASAQLTISASTTFADVTGATVTFTTNRANAVAVVQAMVDMQNSTAWAATGVVGLNVDGTVDPAQINIDLNQTNNRPNGAGTWKVSLASAGSHTIKLQGKVSTTTGAQSSVVQATHTQLVVTVYDQG